jgi:hypothetical protein
MSILPAALFYFDVFEPLPIQIEVSEAPLTSDAGLLPRATARPFCLPHAPVMLERVGTCKRDRYSGNSKAKERFMIRRGVLLLGVLVAVLIGGAPWWPRTNTITRENVAKIQPGMMLAEVEAILGRPPGNYASSFSGRGAGYDYHGRVIAWSDEYRTTWAGDDGMLSIYLDNDGSVLWINFYEVVDPDTFAGSIRRWLLARRWMLDML